MLDIKTDRGAEARLLVIHLRGRIDALSAREFDDFFEELLRGGERFFILRASALESVSSAGIGSLVKFARRLHGLGGAAVFVRLPEEIHLLFDFFGLGALLPAFDEVERAREYLQSRLVHYRAPLEMRRDRTLRTPVGPGTNRGRLEAREAAREDLEPTVQARPLESDDAELDHLSHPDAPTEAEMEIMAEAGPTEAEMEIMAEAGPTEAEQELMADAGPTEAEQELMNEELLLRQAMQHEYRADENDADGYPDDDERALDQEIAALRGNDFSTSQASDQRQESGAGQSQRLTHEHVSACQECGLQLRVYKSGLHMCPACGTEFEVRRDGRVSFYEKL